MSNFDLIIFDMDGTLYNMEDLIEPSFHIAVDYLIKYQNYDKESAIKLLNSNDIYPYVYEKAKSTTQLFASMGFSIPEWNDFRSIAFPFEKINKNNAATNDLLISFSKLCTIVLLTNNSQKNVDNVLKHLDIKKETFDNIFLNDANRVCFNKKVIMSNIINKYNVKLERVLSIGDRYNIDGLPMLELGGKSIIVSNPSGLKKVLEDNPDFKDNDKYKYYDKIKEPY